MRARHVRLFSMPDVTHIDLDAGPVSRALAVAEAVIDKPDELTWWDWAVFLLHTAAEIEHALLVQYLYAAYSLADGDPLAQGWRRTIVGIAREEMAHLLTIQNLLRFIGGPLNLEREDFPYRAFLYPFPFALEPLTKTSLAKYVVAEMPAVPPQPPQIIQEIVDRATNATGGLPINRVGSLYDALIGVFEDATKLADFDLRPETADAFQADPSDWFAFGRLIVRVVRSRSDAVAALRAVAEQGEGSTNPPPGAPPSHFDLFFQIYTAFPDTATGAIRSIPSNPNTLQHPSTDPAMERGRITDPTTRLWAHLFNVRYRMLLADLAHALHLPGPLEEGGAPTARGHLRTWTFNEMTAGLKAIAGKLVTLPLKQAPGPADPALAGPPFELPYTFALPDNERDRWRLHLALLDTSRDLIGKIEAAGGNDILAELTAIDLEARAVVESHVSL